LTIERLRFKAHVASWLAAVLKASSSSSIAIPPRERICSIVVRARQSEPGRARQRISDEDTHRGAMVPQTTCEPPPPLPIHQLQLEKKSFDGGQEFLHKCAQSRRKRVFASV
jgi:hypothetical protein